MKLYTFDRKNGYIVAQVQAVSLDHAKSLIGTVKFDGFYSEELATAEDLLEFHA